MRLNQTSPSWAATCSPPGSSTRCGAPTPGSGGEIQLTDGIAGLLQTGEVWGLEFEGELLDVGTLDGWLTTNVRLARELGRAPALRGALA